MDKVLVSVAAGADTATVVAALRGAGMVVDEVLEALGVVTGSVAPAAIGSLVAVPGVAAVERARTIGLPEV